MTALRPEYTKSLVKKLNDKPLNIYGKSGQGQLRLLKDLKELLHNENKLIFLLEDMNNYSASYQGFIADITGQLKEYFHTVEEKIKNLKQFLAVFDKYADGKHMVLLLNNYDALLDNTQLDEAYDMAFFNDLNTLHHSEHGLVCITIKPCTKSTVFIKKQAYSKPLLYLELIPLPSLTQKEIINKLSCELK
jgi:hypothetical protein